MADEADTLRTVSLTRIAHARLRVNNVRGGEFTIGEGTTPEFTPVELLLAGIAGCTAIDVDYLTSRRAEPESFEVTASAEKLRDDTGNHLGEITVEFRVRFPEGEDGDRARARLGQAISRSHDRLCTVSRTVERGTPVHSRAVD